MARDEALGHDQHTLRCAVIVEGEGAERHQTGARHLHWIRDFCGGRDPAPHGGGVADPVRAAESQPQRLAETHAAAVAAGPDEGGARVRESEDVRDVGEGSGHRTKDGHHGIA